MQKFSIKKIYLETTGSTGFAELFSLLVLKFSAGRRLHEKARSTGVRQRNAGRHLHTADAADHALNSAPASFCTHRGLFVGQQFPHQ